MRPRLYSLWCGFAGNVCNAQVFFFFITILISEELKLENLLKWKFLSRPIKARLKKGRQSHPRGTVRGPSSVHCPPCLVQLLGSYSGFIGKEKTAGPRSFNPRHLPLNGQRKRTFAFTRFLHFVKLLLPLIHEYIFQVNTCHLGERKVSK